MNMDLEGEGNEKFLEAQAHIMNHVLNFINSMSLKCAVQLGIPDAIDRHGPNAMSLSELVSALQLHPHKTQFINRLMRILTHSGFFQLQKLTKSNGNEEEEEDQEGYSLTNSSRLLLKDNSFTVTPLLLSMLEPAVLEPWQFLSAWFQTEEDRTPFNTAHGLSFWEYTANNPNDGDIFNAAMANDARLVMSVLLGKYKGVFDGIGSLVDVGGGTGTVAKAIAEAFPQIECTVLDLPQVVADFKGEGNLKYVEGDMFQAIPHAHAILLKWILHNWSDEECVEILKKCKEALITSNGRNKEKVIAIDIVVGNQKNDDSMETQLFYDMLMMVSYGGLEREEKEWARLIKEAGFSGYKIFPIIGFRSLIEIYP